MPSKVKQVKKKKKPRSKTMKPLQSQTQKQVVNITFEKPKKSKRKKKRKQREEIMPQQVLASRMDLLSSDTARMDTLFNRLYDLQNKKMSPPPPPSTASPVSIPIAQAVKINPDNLIPQKTIKSTTPPPVKELPVAKAVEIVNPPLLPDGVLGGVKDVFDIFSGLFPQETPDLTTPKAKVKKTKIPKDAPKAKQAQAKQAQRPTGILEPNDIYGLSRIGQPLNSSNLEPPILTLEQLNNRTLNIPSPLLPKPIVIPTLLLPNPIVIPSKPITFDMDDYNEEPTDPKDITTIEKYGWAEVNDGEGPDMLNPFRHHSTFKRNQDIKKVKKKLKLKLKKRTEEKADDYKGVIIAPDFDDDENQFQVNPLDPLITASFRDELIPSTNTTREPVDSLVRGYEGLGVEPQRDETEFINRARGERSDKGVRRGFYKPTTDKFKADDFRNEQIFKSKDSVVRSDETLLRDIFGDWRQTTTDSIAL